MGIGLPYWSHTAGDDDALANGQATVIEVQQQIVIVLAIFRWEKSGPLVSDGDWGMLTSAWRGDRDEVL
jgi:hypothetical protein